MAWIDFYAPARWGNRFGIKGPHYGPQGHRGHDIKAGAGSAVPALRAGTVVVSQYSSVLGYVVVVHVRASQYDGYAHVTKPVPVGTKVVAGSRIGYVAGWNDKHGSAWDGPHLHMTNGPTATSVFSGTVRDPAPIINAVRTALAGGGTTPKPIPKPEEEEDEMKPIVVKRTEGNPEWSLIAPWITGDTPLERGYSATTDVLVARAWGRMFAKGQDTGLAAYVDRAGYIAIQAEARKLHDEWKKYAISQGGTTNITGAPLDTKALEEAIARVEAAVNRLNPPG